MLQTHSAGRQYENAVRPGFNEHLRIGVIQADDIASKCNRRIYQVPIVLHLQYGLGVFYNPHFAQSHGASEVLYVQRPKAGRV
jgi:hypothetical protein